MRKLVHRLTVLWLSLLLCFIGLMGNSYAGSIKTVVIDAGHGGHDPGAIGKSNTCEKDINLKLALKVGKLIEENFKDIKVVYTRDKDVFVELRRRTQIANENHADLFISIHCNSAPNNTSNGTETFVMSTNNTTANLAVAQKENAAILLETNYKDNYEGFDPNSVDAYIIFSLYQNAYLNQSIKFASCVQKHFRENLKLPDRGVKQAGFLVLWRTTMPSVLIEAGFLSNLKEESYLASEIGQNEIAQSIFKAFCEWKKEKEKNIASSHTVVNLTSNDNQEKKPNSSQINSDKEVFFSVQISCLTDKKNLNDPIFKGLQTMRMWQNGKYYCYAAGEETSYESAVSLLNSIKNKGFPDAFLIAFRNGEKISIKEAKKYLNK